MRTEFFKNYIDCSYDEINELKQYIQYDIEKLVYNHLCGENVFEVNFDLNSEFDKLFNRYVPSSETANTKYGEIIRGINKLIYRWYNDGDNIETGSYSGIMYGLRECFEIPFFIAGESVYFTDEYEKFNDEIMGISFKYYVANENMTCYDKMIEVLICSMKFATILLGYIEDYDNHSNCYDISKYYDNIVNFIVNEDIIKIFKEGDFDITNNFGCYDRSYMYYDGNIIINDIDEDIHINIGCYRRIKFEFFTSNVKFEFETTTDELKSNLELHQKLLKYIYNYSHSNNRQFDIDYVKSLGYEINDRVLQKVA